MHTSKRPRLAAEPAESPLTGPGGAPLRRTENAAASTPASIGPTHNGILLQYMFMPRDYTPSHPAAPESAASAAPRTAESSTEEDEVSCIGELTRQEKDAELQAKGSSLEKSDE